MKNQKDEINIKQLVLNFKEGVRYLLRKWMVLLVMGIVGAAIGLLYAKMQEPKYIAECTFVFDDPSKTSGLVGLVSLGVGGDGGGKGIFQQDNLVWLYSSRLMVEQTLLTQVDSAGKPVLLINWFIAIDKNAGAKLKAYTKSGTPVIFKDSMDRTKFTRAQNDVLAYVAKLIIRTNLTVGPLKDNDGIISVKFKSKDELFAKTFVDNIVSNVNTFYIDTKTKSTATQVAVLQKKVDEFNSEMNKSMYQAASANDNIPNVNPAHQVLRVAPQRKVVDVQVNSAIYGEMLKQLEAAKISLAKEAPLIKVIDTPILPLEMQRKGMTTCVGAGFAVLLVLTMIYLMAARFFKKVMAG